MIQAGRLRQIVKLIEPILNSRHEESGTIEHEVRAEIRAATGKEVVEARQVNSYLTHRAWIRHQEGVKPSWRILWGQRILRIESATPDSKRREVQLRLVELEPVT